MLRQKYKRRAAYRPTTSSYHPTKKTVLLTENHYSAEKNCLLFNHRTCIMSSEISVQIPPDINKAGSNSSSIYSQQCLLQSKFLATRCCAVNMASRKAGRPTPLILRLLKIPYKNTYKSFNDSVKSSEIQQPLSAIFSCPLQSADQNEMLHNVLTVLIYLYGLLFFTLCCTV